MSKTAKKTLGGQKPGNIYGVKEVVTQSNNNLRQISDQLHGLAKSFGFLSVHIPLVEDEKTYTDYYKHQNANLNQLVGVNIGGKYFSLPYEVLPSLFRYYSQFKLFEESPMAKWFYFENVLSQDERAVVSADFQYGFEVLGNFNHLAEAQVISAVWEFYKRLELPNLELHINMAGDAGVQSSYQNVLKDFLKQKAFDLCDDCNQKIPVSITECLMCSNLDCQLVLAEAPSVLDYLDESSKAHFTNILEALDELSIPYQLNPLYFGKSGSSHTNFMIRSVGESSSVILGEGSYHNQLLKQVHGKPLPAFGYKAQLSTLLNYLQSLEIAQPLSYHEVFLVPLGEMAAKKSLRLFRDLVNEQITVHDHFGTEGVKNQLKMATDHKAPVALIMGHKEAMDDVVILRDVKSGMQEVFPFDKIIDEVKKRLGK